MCLPSSNSRLDYIIISVLSCFPAGLLGDSARAGLLLVVGHEVFHNEGRRVEKVPYIFRGAARSAALPARSAQHSCLGLLDTIYVLFYCGSLFAVVETATVL